jgi:predicted nuclease of predicted toxin-antitoxin system
VRFLIDHDVDTAVGRMLRRRRHECWSASEVGLAAAGDDLLTVWAYDHQAAVVSTDKEFGRRRMKNAIGHHVWLRCRDWEARDLLAARLDEVLKRLESRADLTVQVSEAGITQSASWT